MQLSPRWLIRTSLSYCSFYPRDKYEKWLQIGDSIIDISQWKWYQGDHFDSFYSLMLDVKYVMMKTRFSPYIIAGTGLMMERYVSGGSIMVGQEEKLYVSLRGCLSFGGGLGLEYRLNHRFSMFIESRYSFFFYEPWGEQGDQTKGIVPLKIGLSYAL